MRLPWYGNEIRLITQLCTIYKATNWSYHLPYNLDFIFPMSFSRAMACAKLPEIFS